MSRSVKYLLLLLALCVAGTAYGQKYPERKHVRKGNRLYEEQRMEEAQREYRSALQKEAQSVEAKFNLGDSQYAMGDFEGAANTFGELLEKYPDLSPEVKAKTHYNLGNAQFQQQKLEEALESYKSSLKLNPSDMEAKFNYAYTKAMLENQQNQDQNQNQNQDQQQNQDNQQQQQQPENQEGDGEQQPEQNNPEQQPEDGEDNQQPEQPQGDKPEPSDEGEEPREVPSPSPESEQMLDAVQAAEDKTRDKVDAEREAVGVARSGKNW